MKFTRNTKMGVITVSFFPEFTFISYFQKDKIQCWLGCPVLGRSQCDCVCSDKSYLWIPVVTSWYWRQQLSISRKSVGGLVRGKAEKLGTRDFRCMALWETGAACSIWTWQMMSQDLLCWRTLLEWSVAYNPAQLIGVAMQQFCTRLLCRLGNCCSTEWLRIFALKCNVHRSWVQNQAQSKVVNKSCIQIVSKDWVTQWQWHNARLILGLGSWDSPLVPTVGQVLPPPGCEWNEARSCLCSLCDLQEEAILKCSRWIGSFQSQTDHQGHRRCLWHLTLPF